MHIKIKKIVFIIPFFHQGGVERWVSYAYVALKSKGFDVDIICFGKVSVAEDFFRHGVHIKKVTLRSTLKYLFDPQVILITALTKLNLFFSLLNIIVPSKHVSTIHLSLSKKSFESELKYQSRRFFHFVICKLSNLVVSVSSGVGKELSLIDKKVKNEIIYNPCFESCDIKPLRKFDPQRKLKFVSAGRLHRQKRFDILIDAFIDAYPRLPVGSSLTIWGDGDLRTNLQAQIPTDFAELVLLPGTTDTLFKHLANSDVFVLSSEYEGFGNVLVEALANGCQCLSFDIPHGPKEILNNGNFGYLLPFGVASLKESIIGIANGDLNQIENNEALNNHLKKFTDIEFANNLIKVLQKL